MPLPKHTMKVPKADTVTIGDSSFRTKPFKRLYRAVKDGRNTELFDNKDFIYAYWKSPHQYESRRFADMDAEECFRLRDQLDIGDCIHPSRDPIGVIDIDNILVYMINRYKHRNKMIKEAETKKGCDWDNLALIIFGCSESENSIVYEYLFSRLWSNCHESLAYRLLCVMNGLPDESSIQRVKPRVTHKSLFIPDIIKDYNDLVNG